MAIIEYKDNIYKDTAVLSLQIFTEEMDKDVERFGSKAFHKLVKLFKN